MLDAALHAAQVIAEVAEALPLVGPDLQHLAPVVPGQFVVLLAGAVHDHPARHREGLGQVLQRRQVPGLSIGVLLAGSAPAPARHVEEQDGPAPGRRVVQDLLQLLFFLRLAVLRRRRGNPEGLVHLRVRGKGPHKGTVLLAKAEPAHGQAAHPALLPGIEDAPVVGDPALLPVLDGEMEKDPAFHVFHSSQKPGCRWLSTRKAQGRETPAP